ncbi:hypothetical protein LCGC14_2929940, partial [marine sediment metagenome]
MTQHIYTTYNHHGSEVKVRADLKGLHREHCLCFECHIFAPGSSDDCPIAAAIYSNCVKFNVVTPVWECPKFMQGPLRS